MKLRRFLARFVAVTISVVIGLLLGEVGLRVFLPGHVASAGDEHRAFCRFDPEIGWVPVEGFTAKHERSGFSVVVHQNQFGLRGPDDIKQARTPGVRRMIVLGDSYVWGYGVSDAELFSAAAVHGTRDEILNFGVSGYGTDQEYLYYLRLGRTFEVDEVVLALTPYNDISNIMEAEEYGCEKPYFTLDDGLTLHASHIRERKVNTFLYSLRMKSRVFNGFLEANRALSRKLQGGKKPRGTAEAEALIREPCDVSDRDREGVKLAVAILEKLRDAVVARGAVFSVIFIPYMPHVEKLVASNHPLVPLIAAGLTRAGIGYSEPYPRFVEAARGGTVLMNDRDNHFSPAGHALFAKFLVDTPARRDSLRYYER